jgi:hypothetical protein
MDAGVTTHCAAVSCGQPQTAIPLGGQTLSVDSFRTGDCTSTIQTASVSKTKKRYSIAFAEHRST